MTECPECGDSFAGYKCGCGYKLPYNRSDRQAPVESPNCIAFGCPLPGSISETVRPPHRWMCRFHYGEPSERWPRITQRVREFSGDINAVAFLPLESAVRPVREEE